MPGKLGNADMEIMLDMGSVHSSTMSLHGLSMATTAQTFDLVWQANLYTSSNSRSARNVCGCVCHMLTGFVWKSSISELACRKSTSRMTDATSFSATMKLYIKFEEISVSMTLYDRLLMTLRLW